MIVRIITINVKPGTDQAFEQATIANRAGSIREPGVLRFDLLSDAVTADRYYLYEVYRDEAATMSHKDTSHYKEWKASVAEMMATERSSVAGTPVSPTAESEW